MRTAFRYILMIVVGAATGLFAAVYTVRAGALGSSITIGPWQTGRDFGAADASARSRAIVALRGLLALPAREARYYTASTDDAGRPLDGRCRYRVEGGALPGRWWSLTLYDRDGYLVRNAAGRYSVESAAITRGQRGSPNSAKAKAMAAIMAAEQRWTIGVSPAPFPGTDWLPTGGIDHFELTLRLYLPTDGGKGDPSRRILPFITREAC